jgi:hypothetical protein
MRSRISTIIITALGAVAALALVAMPASAATDIHTAALTGSASYPAVNGKAKSQRDDGVRELEAEIEDAKALVGKRVRFVVAGQFVGARTVDALGNAELRRRGSTVPRVVAGSPVRVRLPSGALVAFGRFN